MKLEDQIVIEDYETVQRQKLGRKFAFALGIVLGSVVFVTMLHYLHLSDEKHAIACFKVLIIFSIPGLVERMFKILLPSMLSVSIQLFTFAAIILGEINSFYVRYSFWDVILHTFSGFMWAAVGFMLFGILFNHQRKSKVTVSPLPILIAAFCVSITIGGVWELYEFGADQVMNRDMQKDTIIHTIKSVQLDSSHSLMVLNDISNVTVDGRNLELNGYLDIGLYDTMYDLINNLIGALAFGALGLIDTRILRGKFISYLLV